MSIPSDVIISKNVEEELQHFFKEHSFSKAAVLVDENTRKYCLPVVQEYLPKGVVLIEIKSGEEQKHLETCVDIWDTLTENAFDRKSLLINLGGGVIGDMGGFCAATYKRGIPFVNIPTTLLAQVDASVGGKLGIDFKGYKNHIGVFQEPLRVFICPKFLSTLDHRELRSGFAEVIKHCLIADRHKFAELKNVPLSDQDWEDILSHSVAIKGKVVTEDPQERGLRKILNFGHTLGHAVETFFLNRGNRILHGEAIAIGMVCEAWLSKSKCGLTEDEFGEIYQYIDRLYDLTIIDPTYFEEILSLTLQDKKNENNKVKASLLKEIGSCQFNIDLSREEMEESFLAYNQLVG